MEEGGVKINFGKIDDIIYRMLQRQLVQFLNWELYVLLDLRYRCGLPIYVKDGKWSSKTIGVDIGPNWLNF